MGFSGGIGNSSGAREGRRASIMAFSVAVTLVSMSQRGSRRGHSRIHGDVVIIGIYGDSQIPVNVLILSLNGTGT